MAQWYPVFEAKEFDVVVELPDETLLWDVDPLWFNRILDNVFQNVVRHAGAGRYIGIHMIDRDNQWILVINDKGPGVCNESPEKAQGSVCPLYR